MVRVTSILNRIPMIKFRSKGAGRAPSAGGATSLGACQMRPSAPAAAAAAGGQAPMSSSAIPDIHLPPKYQRQPLSQEEIDHINGGGIV